MSSSLRVAVIHDWLTVMGGAEYTLKQVLEMYPQADIYTIVDILPKAERGWLDRHRIFTSPLQKIPFLAKHYRHMIWMMPFWIEQFDLEQYDLIISDSHAVAKGVIVHPHQKHLAYIYSPMRYAWDLSYEHDRIGVLGRGFKRFFLRHWFYHFRLWDTASSLRPDVIVAISHFIRKRIRKSWGRDATVIYPPVDIEGTIFTAQKEDYYITVSRFVPYKRIDLIIEAFRMMPDKQLIVIGDGPMYHDLSKNLPDNVTLEGYLERNMMLKKLSLAKAFIFMPKEDFGIAPLEALASGTPVIAYRCGGAAETVRGLNQENPTGVFVAHQNEESLRMAVALFESNQEKFVPERCREWAMNFSTSRFKEEFMKKVEKLMEDQE
ncbi:glycosyltransferase [Sulfuricurvum sp.]|uniref:glycosyltransferase n=1 Tax=Sulfuricurvum sp. TaxID=2025608 RepID=UPI00262C3D66|nr:glycosyltransferase [Sulfuricurvum sp.]MDD2266045.1 glycosyltransferase [Sulfuricurvum sp.]MDD2784865.1 glycosyltransferase [Sulfuricurvum sp.]